MTDETISLLQRAAVAAVNELRRLNEAVLFPPWLADAAEAACADVVCVDLFCGAGGLTHGLVDAGVRVVAGVDFDEACKHPYEASQL